MKYSLAVLIITLLGACKGRHYEIPTTSMENTLMRHDKIYVVPSKEFQRDDLVVFDVFSEDFLAGPDESGKFKKHWERRVCRLVALSGDTLLIKNDDLFLNGRFVTFPQKGKLMYDVYSKDIIEEFEEDGNYRSYIPQAGRKYLYKASLSKEEVVKYRNAKDIIDSVVQHIEVPGQYDIDTFFARPSSLVQWNAFNYGPLYIPKPGETIFVNEANFKLFQNIPGIKMGENKIKEPLYFVMGDNRHMAQDSRYIGFISHSRMFGVVR